MAKKLNDVAFMPQLSSALAGWTQSINLLIITQEIINGFPKDIVKKLAFKGMVQPLSPRAIALKPEGQRSWEWLQIHAVTKSVIMKVGDKLEWQGRRYKVMADLNYFQDGFMEFHLVRDFQNESA